MKLEMNEVSICVTILAVIRILFMLLPHVKHSIRFDSLPTSNKWHTMDRNLSILHYALIEPLFLTFVLWGERTLPTYTAPKISTVVPVLWLSILILINCSLFVSCCLLARHYRLLVTTFRSMEFVCTAAFVVDNFFDPRPVPTLFIILKFLCQVIFVTDMHSHIALSQPIIINVNAAQQMEYLANNQYSGEGNYDYSIEDEKDMTLYQLLDRAKPSTMTITDLRAFVEKCKQKASEIKIDESDMDCASSSATDYSNASTVSVVQRKRTENAEKS